MPLYNPLHIPETSMRRRSLSIAAVVGALAVTVMFAPHIRAQRPSRFEREDVNGRMAVAREVIVKFRDPLQAPGLADIATQSDAGSVERVGTTGAVLVRSRSQRAAALVQAFSRRRDVVYAEPNFIIQIASEPNDFWFSELWGLERISAIAAWDIALGSTSNVVGVVDTGIDYTHQDLAGNVWSAPTPFNVTVGGAVIHCAAGTHGFNAITRSCNPMDDHGHGTHVSGTIGALGNNGTGVAGVNWTAQLMGLKFLDDQGSGSLADAITAIEFAVAVKKEFEPANTANVRVLSASWGGPEFSQALLDEINAINDADMLFVAAAGNQASDNDVLPFYPAAFDTPNIVTVAATSFDDNFAWFSNYGATSVHLAAPGDFILSTTPGNNYEFLSGTSMAAPHVSGAAALVLSRCALDTATLKDILLGTADYLPGLSGATLTGGRLNVNSALSACTAPPATPSNLKARGADKRVALSWPSVLGAMRYNVKRSLMPGGPYTLLASGVKAITYTDTAVVNGTTYYYVVSAENTLGHSGDSNQASATPNIPPDLILAAFTVPALGGAGSTIPVSLTTSNGGTGLSHPSVTRLYLSVDSTLDASDTVFANVPVPELAPGAVSLASLSVPIPDNTSAGRYYLIASADADDQLDESNENNNRQSRSILIGPDLIIDTMTMASSGAAGGTISVSLAMRNQGGGAAGATVTNFYLSVNSSISSDDVLLGSRNAPALAAGAANTGTVTLTIPATATVGAYYVVAKVDGSDLVNETTETNNTKSALIQIGGDLVVSALTVPSTGGAGSTIAVTDTTKNQGGAPIGASTTRFYLSANYVLDTADILLSGSRDVSVLDPGASSSGSSTLTLPNPLSTGTYYVIAKADADGANAETSETNNTYYRQILIGGDLVVSALNVPSAGAPGSAIAVTDTTKNQGGAPIAASTTRFYLSTNSVLDTADILLAGSHDVSALDPGTSSSSTTTLTLPSPIVPAAYYIIAKADADGAAPETSETNNTNYRPILIGGDLVVSALNGPSAGAPGSAIVVTDTTKNQGGAPIRASTTRFYLSTNSVLDTADTLLTGSRDVSVLDPGASSSGTTSLTLPNPLSTGTYYIIANADADGAAPETSETNNTTARQILIGGDLVVLTVAGPSTGAPGSAIVVTDTIKNQGAAPIGASTTRFYLSTNWLLDQGDTLLAGSRQLPVLDSGASSSGSTTLTLPNPLATGTYYIIAKADADQTALETSETNNTNYRQILIGGDLVVSSFTVPVKGGPGSALTISDTTTNQGAGAIGPSVTKFYLSTNGSYDSADTLLGSRAVPDLAGGATSTASITVIIPSNATAGTYYLIARADGDAGIAETNELNNNAARSVTIGSDLVVSVPSTTAIKAAAGSSLEISETVINQGAGSSTPSVTRYYLSSNSTLSADDVLLEGGRAVPGLAAGGSSTGSTSLLLPAGLAAGLSYIIAKADGDDTVNETSETNNTASRAVSIGPDLIVSATSAPSSAAAGTAINVSDTVLNQGADGAAATVTRFYLSTNAALDAADMVLGEVRAVPSVAAGTSNAGTTAVTIPTTTAVGSYYLLVKADGNNAVGESYETNNVSARWIQVTAVTAAP